MFTFPVYPYVKLPLHLTLYFFPNTPAKENTEAAAWVRSAGAREDGSIVASAGRMSSFSKDGHDLVYYLPIFSPSIFDLRQDLHDRWSARHTDPFDFVPHVSLFYPGRDLNEQEKNAMQALYRNIEHITFDRLAFAAEKGSGTHFLNVQHL